MGSNAKRQTDQRTWTKLDGRVIPRGKMAVVRSAGSSKEYPAGLEVLSKFETVSSLVAIDTDEPINLKVRNLSPKLLQFSPKYYYCRLARHQDVISKGLYDTHGRGLI